ncbi:MAG: hypothetical protein R6X08_04910 [Desulfosalsimonadaceae bacterium]
MGNAHRCRWWIGIGVLLLFCSGCAFIEPGPDIGSTGKKEGDAYSAEEKRRILLDHPGLLSGDYFLKRKMPEAEEKAAPEQSADQGRKSGRAEQASGNQGVYFAGKGDPAAGIDGRQIKAGLFFDTQKGSAAAKERLMQAAWQAAPENFLLINDAAIRELLVRTECMGKKDLSCMAENLALYPGVRMLIVAEEITLPESLPGRAAFSFSVMDAGLLYRYPAIQMQEQVEKAEAVDSFLRDAMEEAFAYASRKAELMPRHCRVFSVKNQRAYISMGRASGIKAGDVLQLVSGGEVVTSPGGLPVAWVPATEKSRIRVESLVGDRIAACSPEDGQMPEMGDYVLLSK